MTKKLSTADVNAVVTAIRQWEGKISWDALVKAVPGLVGKSVTRVTLYNTPSIGEAFQARKRKGIRYMCPDGPAGDRGPSRVSIASMIKRVERLRKENERLALENSRLVEKFLRWEYNALSKMSLEQLDKPMPPKPMG